MGGDLSAFLLCGRNRKTGVVTECGKGCSYLPGMAHDRSSGMLRWGSTQGRLVWCCPSSGLGPDDCN
jgi:hypothetical protein